jgi:hypothetical protein
MSKSKIINGYLTKYPNLRGEYTIKALSDRSVGIMLPKFLYFPLSDLGKKVRIKVEKDE